MKDILVGWFVILVCGGVIFALCMLPDTVFFFVLYGIGIIFILTWFAKGIGHAIRAHLEQRDSEKQRE